MKSAPAPPVGSVSWIEVLRRPLLFWSAGVLVSAILLLLLLVTRMGSSSSSSSTMTMIAQIVPPPPFGLAILLLGFSGWTLFSVYLLGRDVCRHIRQGAGPAAALLQQPAVLLETAAQWSLDDALRFLVCELPTHLATWIAGCVLLPVTLYALVPTTLEQRARVLRAAGVLDDDDDTILTEPGAWRQLLPGAVQHLLQTREEKDAAAAAAAAVEEQVGSDAASSSDDDDEEESCCVRSPYSISPVWTRTMNKEQKESTLEQKAAAATTERISNSQLQQQQKEQQTENLELHEMLQTIVTDLLKAKVGGLLQQPQQQTVALSVASSAAAVLFLQMRHSATARALVRQVVHGTVAAGSGMALLASLVALLGPRYYHVVASASSLLLGDPAAQRRNVPGSSGVNGNSNNTIDWKLVLSPLITAAALATATTGMPSPGSLPLRLRMTTTALRQKLGRFSWKGAAAVLVWMIFQQRRRRRLEREEAEQQEQQQQQQAT